MSEIPDEYRAPDQKDLNRLIQYLAAAVSDPIRVSVLLAHGLIEELIDEFIKELVPNHDFLDLPKTGFSDKLRWARRLDCEGRDEPFWKFIASFNELRNAAAHRNWNEKRVECFSKVRQITATLGNDRSLQPVRIPDDDQEFVRLIMALSVGYLSIARDGYRQIGAGN